MLTATATARPLTRAELMESLRYDPADAIAQDEDEPIEWTRRQWTVQTEARVWAPGMGARLRLPGGDGTPRVSRELDAGDPRATPAGEFRYHSNGVTFGFSGAGFGLSERSTADRDFSLGDVAVSTGDRFDIDIDHTTIEALVEWRIGEFQRGRMETDLGVSIDFDLGVGARLYDVNMRLEAPGGETSGSGLWVEPVVSARMSMEMLDRYTVESIFSGGGFSAGGRTSISWTAQVAFHWRFFDNAGAQIGFRHHHTDLRKGSGDDRLRFNGSLSGLFLGVVIRF